MVVRTNYNIVPVGDSVVAPEWTRFLAIDWNDEIHAFSKKPSYIGHKNGWYGGKKELVGERYKSRFSGDTLIELLFDDAQNVYGQRYHCSYHESLRRVYGIDRILIEKVGGISVKPFIKDVKLKNYEESK